MIEKLALPEIRELLEVKDLATLEDVLNSWIPVDLAGVVGDLRPDEQVQVLRTLKPPVAAAAFEYLDQATQERLLGALTDDESARILNDMAPDDRTALLAELPEVQAQRLLGLLDPEQRAVAQAL